MSDGSRIDYLANELTYRLLDVPRDIYLQPLMIMFQKKSINVADPLVCCRGEPAVLFHECRRLRVGDWCWLHVHLVEQLNAIKS